MVQPVWDTVVKVLEHMEMQSHSLSPYNFKVLEPFRVKDDYEELANKMLLPGPKPNPSRLRSVAAEILARRWWWWVLCHPELTEDRIHPSRSMQYCCCCAD